MLMYRRTSIMESTAQTLVNTVNCVGVMGKGLAKAFKDREPDMFRAYQSICEQKLLSPGKLWLWQGKSQWVLNFPTKDHWRQPSRIEWVELGLKKFVATYSDRGITEISFPRLGCGNGNLDWEDVRPLMERYLSEIDIPVYIHDHTVDIGLPEHLEYIASQIAAEGRSSLSFEGFLSALRRVAEIGRDGLVDLNGSTAFDVRMDLDEALSIETQSQSLLLERDDLRGIWMSLLRGVVTQEKAGWSSKDAGSAMLAVLSVLPSVRPIQVQAPQRQPQLAVELHTGSIADAPPPNLDKQLLLA